MARASTRTQLPLDTFAKYVGINPLHFNQIEIVDLAPATDASMPMLQYEWQQADRIGREALAREIRSVEEQLEPWLGFSPLARWYEEEKAVTRPGASYSNWYEQLRRAYVISGGVERWTFVGNAPIVYTDNDGDGYAETADAALITDLTTEGEVAICYPDVSEPELWEIRPTEVSIFGGVATITCRREQLVLAELMEGLAPRAIDGLDDSNFLDSVDVYRHWNDPSDQGVLEWISTTTPSTQPLCIVLRDPRLGIARIQEATCMCCGRPERVILRYYAGEKPYVMDSKWAYVITALTCAQIDRPLCGGDTTQALIKYWKEDKTLRHSTDVGSSSWAVGKAILDNPLGTTRAAEYAWRMIQQYQLRIA